MPGAPTTTAPETTFAPGARVLIRDAEWVVRSVVFTVNQGLPGVGLPRKADPKDTSYTLRTASSTRTGLSLGWEDIRDLPDATITRTILDDTLPGGPHERTITYEAPFTRCNREDDYRTAWVAFSKRLDRPKATETLPHTTSRKVLHT